MIFEYLKNKLNSKEILHKNAIDLLNFLGKEKDIVFIKKYFAWIEWITLTLALYYAYHKVEDEKLKIILFVVCVFSSSILYLFPIVELSIAYRQYFSKLKNKSRIYIIVNFSTFIVVLLVYSVIVRIVTITIMTGMKQF